MLMATSSSVETTTTPSLEKKLEICQKRSAELHGTEEILDAYFVDDGCYMIAHKQAAELVSRNACSASRDRLDLLEISAVSEHGKTEVLRGADGLCGHR